MSDLFHEFIARSKYANLEPSAQSHGEPQPPLELPYDTTGRLVELPPPDALDLEPVNPRALLEERVTIRNYRDDPLSAAELSYLLWTTQGVKMDVKPAGMKRTVPSAGARHPFETVILANNVDGLQPGLYRYLASAHQLVSLSLAEDLAERMTAACLGQHHVRSSAVTFVWVAVPERTAWRYSGRALRYVLIDAGHICQNLYLAAWAIHCGVCAIGAFDDDALNGLLELDGETQLALYAATVGRRR
jgi:SagB-type dehydrogenase family enzyme